LRSSRALTDRLLGTFFQGYTANANANYDAEEVIRRSNHSIVFVSSNYRVGLYGFLAGEEVRRNGTLNVGLLDQRFVVQWIQKHISKVGRLLAELVGDTHLVASSHVRLLTWSHN
jgi:hypothetical protein